MSIRKWTVALWQWRFPAEFRIRPTGPEDPSLALASALAATAGAEADARRESAALAAEVATLRDKAAAAGPSIPAALAVALSNECFRLRRNADQLPRDQREVRSIRKSLEGITEAMRGQGIEYVDLTGQDFDAGRLDFEPLGADEPRHGLAREQITRCERPAVLLNGKLLQKAKGLVAYPA
jgi:hypothetical protein